jgi:hypothetical protein
VVEDAPRWAGMTAWARRRKREGDSCGAAPGGENLWWSGRNSQANTREREGGLGTRATDAGARCNVPLQGWGTRSATPVEPITHAVEARGRTAVKVERPLAAVGAIRWQLLN